MKKLSDFLGIEEGVEFRFNNTKRIELIRARFKIENNKLLIKRDRRDTTWGEANIDINELISLNIAPLTKGILTSDEKEYFKSLNKLFKNRIVDLTKNTYGGVEYIVVGYSKISGMNDSTALPDFEKGTEYKGMQPNIIYTLKDLELEN